jgi:transcription elongation factor SPT5
MPFLFHRDYAPQNGTSSNDDVWRPGGSIDRPAEEDNDGWGSSTTPSVPKQDPFSTSTSETGGGWGSSNNDNVSSGTWAPSTNIAQQSNETAASLSTSNLEDNTTSRYGSGIDAATMGAADGEEAPVWFMERVCIQLRDDDATAVIVETNNNVAVIKMSDESSRTIRASECVMVQPKEHDTVLVTGGAELGVEGELICIDHTDAIIKDSNEDFKIVDFVHIAKIVGDQN